MNARRLAVFALVLAVVLPAFAGSHLDTRVFVLRHRSASEAGRMVERMLSDEGSLTVQPGQRRLTVQDRAEVVRRVARFLQQFDAAPPEFRVRISLFRASNGNKKQAARPSDPSLDPGMLEKMRRMFRYDSFELLGWSVVRGEPGGELGVGLNDRYRVVFSARVLPAFPLAIPIRQKAQPGKDRKVHGTPVPAGSPKTDFQDGFGTISAVKGKERLRLEHLRLLQRTQGKGDGGPMKELLKTSLMLAPGQSVVLGAAASENAPNALILVVEALEPSEE